MNEKQILEKRIMVFGTFDILHKGHEDFFRQAKNIGGHLIVVVAREKTIREVKKISPINNEYMRVEVIRASGFADSVILGGINDKYLVIKEHRPKVICLGYDQKYFIKGLKTKLKEFGLEDTKIVKLKPFQPDIFKTSKIRKIKNI